MTPFIDDHRDAFGVEPICLCPAGDCLQSSRGGVLPIAPSTYHAYAMVKRNPDLASRRAKRDAVLLPEVKRVWDDNLKVYGVRKVWHQLRREGFDVARCTVARLMKRLGLQGVIRGKGTKTTVSDKSDPCPEDKVNRQFRAPAPNRLCPLSAASIACRVRGQRFHLCVDRCPLFGHVNMPCQATGRRCLHRREGAGVCLRRLRN